ncbi:type II secretion system protein GspL [Legionella jordanis]|uniref:Type II secretion system protein L n=1 Tax=Legionella jordanis TaxID=456 RepID=A0A0W0VE59_9GAMM|nr:type II secretion system protein GspL [Legionella jordanis]KTD18436.1 general secretion pathway protein L [Legionella jordanis]RMX05341.1 general secretion pathway protein GspL [Legionella jordanis]RMX20811.1 general secretion pathway protein GspL [Legionella jordanis]VEH13216.1 general secretion pathway protein L [Legionella jordanis]HAT8715009.1 general secretion pathway protein GspL [Legionella jordanis]
MATCFLFIDHFNENACLSLSLDQLGQVIAPLAERNIQEIKALQKNCQTFVVLPTSSFSIHKLPMPWISEKKARAAIPFALEDKLAQNFNSLHFAFDRTHYSHGEYLIVVGDKNYLADLIAKFDEHDLDFDHISIDWFGLAPHEIAILPSYILVNEKEFQGALGQDLMPLFFNPLSVENHYSIFKFDDSNPDLIPDHGEVIDTHQSSYLWLAQRLQKTKSINLCQGEMAHGGTQTALRRWYLAATAMTVIWLLSVLGFNAWSLHQINQEMTHVDSKIANIYHQFFPQAQQVVSPKFRISQLLKANQNSNDQTFWILTNTLAKSFKAGTITFEQIRFQNQMLLVTLATANFAELEDLQNRLQQAKIKVRQTQASTEENKVIATLELSL